MNFRYAALLLLLLSIAISSCRGEKRASGPSSSTASPKGSASSSPGQPEAEASAGVPDLGDRMPRYEAKMLDGSPFRLADRRSKVVLLNVWATWCGPCRYEIPDLQAMHDKYSPRGLEVIGVSIDDPGMENDVRTFVQSQKMTYPVVLDPQGKIADLFEASVIPTSVLIDRTGTIVWMHRGIVTAGDRSLQKALQKAL